MTYEFSAELWRWSAQEGWFFVSLPYEVADDIEASVGERRGFGSVRVEVSIGATTWRTSIFPSKEEKTFVLPVKAAVRKAERMAEGDVCLLALTVL